MAKATVTRMTRRVDLLRESATCLMVWSRPAFTARLSAAWRFALPKSCDNCASAIDNVDRARDHVVFAPRANPNMNAILARYTRPIHFLADQQPNRIAKLPLVF